MAAALAITIFAVVVALQWTHGAYQAEFGAHPDEAAHYVTGLMIRDYIAAGMPGHPMAYTQNYYNHYPKVALGNWPPLFYCNPGGMDAPVLGGALVRAALWWRSSHAWLRCSSCGCYAATVVWPMVSLAAQCFSRSRSCSSTREWS